MQSSFTQSEIKESPLFWPVRMENNVMFVLDETQIPNKVHYIEVKSSHAAVQVIKDMKTRAFGQFLVVLNTFQLELNQGDENLIERIEAAAKALNESRPTFPFSEVTSMVVGAAKGAQAKNQPIRMVVEKFVQGYMMGIRARRLDRVKRIAQTIQDGDTVLTHCNVSGELAMASAICKSENKKVKYFATETRPYMQGAKLTCWELNQMGADVTLVADNAIGSLLSQKKVSKVIVGSDRSCANGDFANKIGTYQIAVLAKEFKVPFYVLTQPSNKIAKGEDIPIELRAANELLNFEGKRIIENDVDALYPGFDVIPVELVTEAIAINVH